MTSRLSARMGSVWAAAAILLPALAVVRQKIWPHDVWWQLAYGRAIATDHAIPHADTFSFTRAGEPFFDQPWLAQLAMYGIERAGGMAALVCAQAAVVACAMGLLVFAGQARTADVGAAARGVLLFALPLSIDNWGVRPQTWALVPFAAFVLVLARWRAGLALHGWVLPLAMLFWVNLHGSFVLGLALVLVHLAGWGVERALGREAPGAGPIVVWGGLAATTTLANPRAHEVYGYVAHLALHPSMARVTEWGDANRMLPFMVVLLVLLVAVSKRRPPTGELIVLVAMAAFGLRAARNAMWVGAIAGVVLAPPLAQWLHFDGSRRVPFGRAVIAFAAVLVVLRSPLGFGAVVLEDTPEAAIPALRAMRDARPRRLFAAEGTGAYLMWAAPEQKTFVDTRIELYPPRHWDAWAEIERAEDAGRVTALLDAQRIDGVLASKSREVALLGFLSGRPAWERRWEDPGWAIFVRAAQSPGLR